VTGRNAVCICVRIIVWPTKCTPPVVSSLLQKFWGCYLSCIDLEKFSARVINCKWGGWLVQETEAESRAGSTAGSATVASATKTREVGNTHSSSGAEQ